MPPPTRATHLAWTVVVAIFAVVPVVAENWPQFRGTQAGLAADHPSLPATWSRTQNVVWKVNVPGRSWSSPVVWGDHVFVTTVVRVNAPFPALKPVPEYRGLSWNGSLDEKSIETTSEAHRWVLYDVDFRSGRIRWERVLHTAVPSQPVHQKNTYFSETPATDGERVYVYSGSIGLFAFDMSGKPVWSKPMPAVKSRMGWGTAASPTLHKGRLYVVNDNEEQSFLAAYDAPTGRELWRVNRDEHTNYSTPLVWENELRTEIVTTGTGRVRSYDLNGRPLWDIVRMSVLTVPSPLARHGLLFVSAGYIQDRTSRSRHRPGAAGDISLKAEKRKPVHCVEQHADQLVSTVADHRRGLLLHAAGSRLPHVPRREDRKRDLRTPAHIGRVERVFRVALELQRPDLRPERGRRYFRDPGGARVQDSR
jgi:hypothetical protein